MTKPRTPKMFTIHATNTFMQHWRNISLLVVVLMATQSSFIAFSASLQAQDSTASFANDGVRYGAIGMGVYNRHSAQFFLLPGVPRPKKEQENGYFPFRDGTGFGFSAGGFVEVPIFRWLNFHLGTTYVQHSGTLTSALDSEIVGRRDGTGSAALFRREFQVNLATVGAEALLTINPVAGLNLYGGVRAEWAVAKTYQQAEVLLSPSDGTFETGKRTRAEFSGVLPEVRAFGVANMNAELIAGIGYEFPIMPSAAWTLETRAFYAKQLNSVVQYLGADEFWKIDAVRAGVSLRYYPVREARFDAQAFKVKQLETLEKQILQERKKIQAELHELRQAGVLVKLGTPVGIADDGSVIEQPTVRVEEFRSKMIVHLLPHIFFNEESAVIPARYRRITAPDRHIYSFNKLATLSAADIHFHLLNIIGKRLQDSAKARITLTGYNVGAKEAANPRNFARQRAEAVSDYFQDVWRIPASRITLKEQTISDNAATTPDAQADARRVDIASDDVGILQALTLETVYRTVTPPVLRYALDINTGAGLKQWNLEMSKLEGNEVQTLKAATGTSTYPKEFLWQIDEQPVSIPTVSGTIESRLDVTDVNNRNADAPIQSTPVIVSTLTEKINRKSNDVRVDIVTLVAPLGKNLTEIDIQLSLKPLIQSSSVVVVEGWAEDSAESLNTQGAESRARSASEALAKLGTTAKVKSSNRAVAWAKPLHTDGTIPEGRLYNRAVRVEIRSAVR